jgi:HlyD family secretion protein
MKNIGAFATALAAAAAITAALTGCGNSSEKYDAAGAFEATEIVVSAEAAGRILEFPTKEGSAVSAGTALGRIDTLQLELKRDQLRATLGSVESRRPDIALQIAALEQQLETARTEKRRIENLLKADAASAKQLDDAGAQVAILERQLAAQKSSLSRNDRATTDEATSLRLQIAQLDDQISKGTIVSPIAGIVLAKYAERGELASIGRNLFKVADLSSMHLRAYVVASQLTRLKLGQRVKVYADYGESGKRSYVGTVSWISDKAEFTPKTIQTREERADLVYAVKVGVENDGFLKIGMYGSFDTGE